MDLKITKKINKFNHTGEIKLGAKEEETLQLKFWKMVASNIDLPGHRKGRAPMEVLKKNIAEEDQQTFFAQFITAEFGENIFEFIRNYTKAESMQYLESSFAVCFNNEGKPIIPLLVTLCDKVELPKILEVSKDNLIAKDELIKKYPLHKFRQKQESLFLYEHNKYSTSKNPSEVGDLINISGSLTLANNPELVVDNWLFQDVIVGVNAWIPQLDEKLTGIIPGKRMKSSFIYPPEAESIFAGQKVVFRVFVLNINKPKYRTLKSLFEAKKKVNGFTEKSFEQSVLEYYSEFIEERQWSKLRDKVAKEILSRVPDFNLDIPSNADFKLNDIKLNSDTGKTNISILRPSVDAEWGRFEYHEPTSNLKEAYASLSYTVTKLECLLLVIFNIHSKEINKDYRMTLEELEVEIENRKEYMSQEEIENPTFVKMHIEKRDKMSATMDWLTDQVWENGKVLL